MSSLCLKQQEQLDSIHKTPSRLLAVGASFTIGNINANSMYHDPVTGCFVWKSVRSESDARSEWQK